MIDAYDKVILEHIRQFLKVGDTTIPIYAVSAEDAQDSLMTMAGLDERKAADTISFPIVMLVRLPDIELTDDPMTKRELNYRGYNLKDTETGQITLNSMRCNLKYVILVFAENRKITEDLGTQLFYRLRNNNQILVNIRLPLKDDEGESLYVQSNPDIVMDGNLTQLRTQQQNLAQLYKLKFSFTLKHCQIFDFLAEKYYNLEYTVTATQEG